MDNSIKNNKIVKYSMICFVTLMIIITFVALLLSNSSKKKSMASNIEYITEEINTDVMEISKVSPETVTSSNPYDYIENSEGYDKLVDLGIEAIPYITEYVNDADACLTSYILAIAMEDITDCSIYEAEGVDWCTSKEFADAWNNFRNTSKYKVNKILNSNKAIDEKIDELKPYGVFAVPAINNMENKNITRGISENNNSDMMKLVKYGDSFKLDSNEIEFLDNYLK